MSDSRFGVRPLGLPGDLGWAVQAHGEIYAAEYGWDTSFEALVAKIVAEYAEKHDPAREAAWIAEAPGIPGLSGGRAGCVFCVDAGADTAQLRILLVDPAARGHGLGGRLVDECVAFAREAGYSRMKLWTQSVLTAARAIYVSRGFRLVAEDPHQSFGADLTGEVYELDLRRP